MTGPRDGSWLDDLDPGELDRAVTDLDRVSRAGGTVVLAAHVAPDGDALGATLALHVGLSRLGARTVPTVGEDPLRIPAALADLPGVGDLRVPAALPDDVDLLVTLDAASPERLGSVAGLLDDGVPTLVVDHHARHTEYGTTRLVAPRAAATVLVVDELLRRLGVALTRDVATCLYVGLVTDTGRFGYAATDPAAFELGARLVGAGVDHAGLNRRLFGIRSLSELRLLGRALERLRFDPDVALVHTHLTADEVAGSGTGVEATEAVIDVVRTADVADVALVCKPAPEGGWRASLRSDGAVDVGALAQRLGGGGHERAAGFTAAGDVDEVVAAVTAALRDGRDT